MVETNSQFPQALTFDDVLLLPGYTDFSRSDIKLTTQLTKTINLEIPFVSSPMDTVTESRLAIALAKLGGIGIIHRNLTIKDQVAEVAKVKSANLMVGAAIGSSDGFEERVEALISAKCDVIVLDAAHGYAKSVINALKFIKKQFPQIQIIAGSIATADGAKALIDAGADALRVGMGPGSICTTRVVSGMGVPQITAILDIKAVSQSAKVPIIADGGLNHSGDVVKALAAGASTVMMGSFFAATVESPGELIELGYDNVPSRFKSIANDYTKIYQFKTYRGMGSVGAMNQGAKIKSEDEFHGKSYAERVLVAEGVEGLVEVKGTVKDRIDQMTGGIRSGMYYVGAKTVSELTKKARFVQITGASLKESHPHDILITNAGASYNQ